MKSKKILTHPHKAEVVRSWLPVVVMVACDATGVPLSYLLNTYALTLGYTTTLTITLAVLTGLVAAVIRQTWRLVHDRMYYGFAVMSFSCVANLLLALEVDGLVSGFMTLYLAHCEPYLQSSWGAIACYSDFIIFLPCYVVMAYRASNGLNYRTLGLHYAGGMLNAMVVMLVGACLSQSGPTLVTLLLAPYVVLPLMVAVKCLWQERNAAVVSHQLGWVDAVLAVLLLEAALATLIRGLASLQSDQSIPAWYRDMVEPVLKQTAPAPFAAVQGLVSLFYFLPMYVLVAGGLYSNPAQDWLQDVATPLAGASLQAGVTQLGMSFHATSPQHPWQPLSEHSAPAAFWAANLLVSVVPQLVMLRLCFMTSESPAATSSAITTKKTLTTPPPRIKKRILKEK